MIYFSNKFFTLYYSLVLEGKKNYSQLVERTMISYGATFAKKVPNSSSFFFSGVASCNLVRILTVSRIIITFAWGTLM